ncbi:MAG: FtsX-like permease family protein [Candidatus Neomarinimicrobiota bacterium]|nr:FtsX-like permease family protein [Candidatus Neomarinimicrobiota bacterium]
MSFPSLIARKFMFSRKEVGPSRFTGSIAIIGIAVGTMAMILSVSVLNGFESRIIEKIIGFEGDVKVSGDIDYEKNINNLYSIDNVEDLLLYKERKGLILGKDSIARMITMKSVDIDKIKNFYEINLDDIIVSDLPVIVLGKTTASRLNLNIGDEVKIMSPLDQNAIWGFPRQVKSIVGGIFDVQVLDFNDRVAFIPSEIGKKLFIRKNNYDGIDIKIKEDSNPNIVKKSIKEIIPNSKTETWKELHSKLFSAMKLERIGSLIVLSLIVLVGCFNLSTTLMLITIQKIKQFGILSALGATKKIIRDIIIRQGIFTGSIGIILGLTIGLSAVLIQNIFGIIKLPGDIYFTSKLPMIIYFSDFILIALIALTMVSLSSVIAARRTSSISAKNTIVLEK